MVERGGEADCREPWREGWREGTRMVLRVRSVGSLGRGREGMSMSMVLWVLGVLGGGFWSCVCRASRETGHSRLLRCSRRCRGKACHWVVCVVLEVRKRKKGCARGCFILVVLRDPKATLDTLGPHWEDNFWTIFGLELDGGKAWRRRLPEALEGGYEHGVEGMNRFWMVLLCGGFEHGLALWGRTERRRRWRPRQRDRSVSIEVRKRKKGLARGCITTFFERC